MAAAFVVGIDLGTTHTVVASAPLGAGGERGGEAGAITLFGAGADQPTGYVPPSA